MLAGGDDPQHRRQLVRVGRQVHQGRNQAELEQRYLPSQVTIFGHRARTCASGDRAVLRRLKAPRLGGDNPVNRVAALGPAMIARTSTPPASRKPHRGRQLLQASYRYLRQLP